MNVVIFAGDSHDIATQRRVASIQALGHSVNVVSFRKSADPCAFEHVNFDLGQVANNHLSKRLLMLVLMLPKIVLHLRKLPDAQTIIARNLDMLLIAWITRIFTFQRSRLIYECLDIHGIFTNGGVAQAVARWVERFLLARVDCLVVSSPAFVSEYFEPTQKYRGEWRLLENKLWLGKYARLRPKPHPLREPRKIRLGWVGNIRCQASFDLLMRIADAMQSDIEIHIHGQIHHHAIQHFDYHIAARHNVIFHGAYSYPQDLELIYLQNDLVWAQDMWQGGANSDWLLPNRVYESGWFGCPSIAVAGTETANFIYRHDLGYCISEPTVDALKQLLSRLDLQVLDAKRRQMLALDPEIFVQVEQDIEHVLCAEPNHGALPSFLCIGAMRAGTTSLFHHCRNHPEINVPAMKETDFFIAEKRWNKGLEWYRSLFSDHAKCAGEFSPNYTKQMVFQDVPKRIHSVAPEMKFIFIARHPVDRAVSQYQHGAISGLDIPDANELVGSHEWRHLVDTSCYAKQLKHYFKFFSRDQFLILDFQMLTERPADVLTQVSDFLGVANTWDGTRKPKHNSGAELAALPNWALRFSNSGMWNRCRNLLPLGLRRSLKRVLKRNQARALVGFTPQMKQDFWHEVRDDMRDFYEMSGLRYEAPADHATLKPLDVRAVQPFPSTLSKEPQ